MRKDFDADSSLILNNSSRSQKPLLKLVTSNPNFARVTSSSTSFVSTICRKNIQPLYTMRAHDPLNDLACKLTLEIENDSGYISVTCKFPSIFYKKLINREDENHVHIILPKFQIKIMRRLLLFAISHNATDLLVQINEECQYAFTIYQAIAAYEDKVPTIDGKLTQMTIRPNTHTWNQWAAIMDKIARKSHQTLWAHHHDSPIIRKYLKFHHLD